MSVVDTNRVLDDIEDNGKGAATVAQANRWAVTIANNTIANYAIGLFTALIVLIMTALVGGEFVAAIPDNSTFSPSIDTMTDNAGTAFTIFGVVLLLLPAGAAIGLIALAFGNSGMGR